MRVLGLVSFVQLLLGVAGLKKALREGRVADVPFAEKRPKKELQQRHWTDGTALSAPTPMLIIQGIASIILIVRRRPPVFFARLLGVLGAIMAIGYPAREGVARFPRRARQGAHSAHVRRVPPRAEDGDPGLVGRPWQAPTAPSSRSDADA